MELYQKKEMCCGCGACAEICPPKAIKMIQDKEGFAYPQINSSACMECSKCRDVCPIKAQKSVIGEKLYMGAQAKEDKVRYSSSSGGVFSVLAQYVIGYQGIVYGAGYNEDMKVIHKGVEKQDHLDQIKRTKYVQSCMDGIYSQIERNLKEGRWVLFCGTPCQTNALMLFLNENYERLILVDLVCYGVPSPGIWNDYVRYLEYKHNGRLTDFSFRDKRNRDNGHVCSYRIDGKEYAGPLYEDLYCRIFFKNYSLRPSCYHCKFCTVNRQSDFTIGDFWGIEHVRPDMDDGMGTSMVIMHSEQAKKIWNEIMAELNWFACTKEDVLQPRLLEPTGSATSRKVFMWLYQVTSFRMIVKWIQRKWK